LIVADSSVWIDYLRGPASAESVLLDSLLGREPILLGDLILHELLRGAPSKSAARRLARALAPFPLAPMVGADVAAEAARHVRTLRAQEVTVRKTMDLLIGTFCLMGDHVLLHRDRDFDAMEAHLGLSVLRA
jgi:predicted nucleic acid-binding protein